MATMQQVLAVTVSVFKMVLFANLMVAMGPDSGISPLTQVGPAPALDLAYT
jgi:hypothetical protein